MLTTAFDSPPRSSAPAAPGASLTPGVLPGQALAVPWVDSPFFEQILATLPCSPLEAELARFYRRNGYLLIEESILDDIDTAHVDAYVQRHTVPGDGRLQDAWQGCPAVRAIATHPYVMALLEFLYLRRPVPFQTLNFVTGTEQRTHSDVIHFNSLPGGFMAGVWVALEDIGPAQGPLHYYPSSHALPEYDHYDIGIADEDLFPREPARGPMDWSNPRTSLKNRLYEDFIQALVEAQGLQRLEMTVRKGSFLIWASNLLHGGSPVLDRTTTRRSQVTHYFFEGVIPVTPMFSNARAGEYLVRTPTNVATGEAVAPSFNGRPVAFSPGTVPGRLRFRVL